MIEGLHIIAWNHFPLILNTKLNKHARRKSFKFEAMWLCDSNCHKIVIEEWNEHVNGS